MSGWDGDALAGQVEDAQERMEQIAEERQRRRENKKVDFVLREKIETLRLSHSRMRQQLLAATNPTYRAMLEKGLAKLEAELEAAEGSAKGTDVDNG